MARLAGRVAGGSRGPGVPSLIAGVAWCWSGWVGRTVMRSQAVTMAGAQGPGRVAGDALTRWSGAPAESASSFGAFLQVKGADEFGAGDGDGVAGGPGLRLYRAGKAEHYAGASSSWISTT